MPATPSFVVLSDESGRAERPRLSVNFTPRMASVSICDPWEKYSRAVWQLNISHTTFNIQHSTFSTSLPQIYTAFPIEPRPAFKYAILACFSQPPNSQPLIFRTTRSAFPHTAFPTTKRHLSTRDSCPFEAPSLTFRISIPKLSQPDTCPTPQSRLPIRHPKRPKPPSRPLFHPKSRHKICTKNFYFG